MSTRPMEELHVAIRKAGRAPRSLVGAHAPRRHWHYSGDIVIECGGMFYDLSTFDDGYVDLVRVQPCSDAGGPDNCYWVERLNVIIHEPLDRVFAGVGDTVATRRAHRELHGIAHAERVETALCSYGPHVDLAEWDKMTQARRKHAIVYACVSYGCHYDQESSEMVSIGAPEITERTERNGDFTPAKVLRANANLRTYARAACDTM